MTPRSERARPSRAPMPRFLGFSSARGSLLIILLASLGLAGCKTPDFIGNRYNNFTAYYNTFYNAERQFKSGYENLDRFDETIDRERYLTLFVRTTGSSASREFEQAVIKSADLLRNHPSSKWVDDALMLIGKSYFYQENYVGALQKFSEVVEMDTGLQDEALFWLSRTLITSGSFDEAFENLTAAMAQEDADREWVAQFNLLLAELSIKQDLFEDAAGHLNTALDDLKDKELAARTAFLLGQVNEKLGRWDEAVASYRDVRNHRAPYELDYAARFSAVRVDGRHVNPDRALSEVRKLERDDKNFAKTGELRYLRARVLQEIGREDEAFNIYDELLYDPLSIPSGSSSGNLKGKIHYALGELYRDIDRNYVMAAAHFDTASTSLGGVSSAADGRGGRSGSGTSRAGSATQDTQYAPEAITDAASLKQSFSNYARVFKDVARYDSLLFLGTLPQEEYDARILELRKARAEELAEQRRILAERQREQAFRNASSQTDQLVNRGLPDGKVIPTFGDPSGQSGGFLFYDDPIRVQEGRLAFQNIWGNRPLAPNWRRSAALSSAGVEENPEEEVRQEEIAQELEGDELPSIDDSAVPRDSTAQLEMRGLRAVSRYELGNILFLGMAKPDSAAIWYRKVIDEDPAEVVSQRALYALAEVQLALGDSLTSTRLYRDILDRFPDSDFSVSVRERLGLPAVEVVATDSVAMAIQAFEDAVELRYSSPSAAIDSLLLVAADWIGYDESDRALFAVGDIHLTEAQRDSAAIFAPIPFTVPSHRLSTLWPKKYEPLPDPVDADSVAMADSMLVDADSVAMADSMLVGADSLAMADSMLVGADSLAMADSMLVGADSLAMADSMLVGADSLAMADSMLVDADSLSMPDSMLVDADSLAMPDSMLVDTEMPMQEPDSLRVSNEPDVVSEASLDTPIEDPSDTPSDSETEPQEDTLVPADSLAIRGDSLTVAGDSLTLATDSLQVDAEPVIEPLGIEDIYSRIVSTSGRKKVGIQAKSILDALIELRTPPPPDSAMLANMRLDSLRLDSLRLDSLQYDSIGVYTAGGDSLGYDPRLIGVVDSTAAVPVDSTQTGLPPNKDVASDSTGSEGQVRPVMSDSDVLALVARAAAADSARQAQQRAVPRAGSPSGRSEDETNEDDGYSNDDYDVRTTSNLKPLLPTGRPDLGAVGYTLTFGSHFDLDSAREQLNELSAKLDSTEIPLYVITNAEGEKFEYLVGWGMFSSIKERVEAETRFAAILPETRNLMHLLPTEDRRP
jgi:tetratricopeptide (TPR) repeat protein